MAIYQQKIPKKKNQKIKIIAWNKGPGLLENKFNQIQDIIRQKTPHVMIITELNLPVKDSELLFKPPGYQIELDSCRHRTGVTRTAILISDQISYKRRLDLDPPDSPVICIQIGLPNTKQILLQAVYRNWQDSGQKQTKKPSYQYARFDNIIKYWRKKTNTEGREVISLGDFNLDSDSWELSRDKMTDHHKIQIPMVNKLRESIIPFHT